MLGSWSSEADFRIVQRAAAAEWSEWIRDEVAEAERRPTPLIPEPQQSSIVQSPWQRGTGDRLGLSTEWLSSGWALTSFGLRANPGKARPRPSLARTENFRNYRSRTTLRLKVFF